jgi:hypothetical protein
MQRWITPSADPLYALLSIRMFALAGRMLDGKDDNFLGLVVSSVVDQIRISPHHQLTHALDLLLPSDVREQNQTLQRFNNRRTHTNRSLRAVLADIIGDLGEIPSHAA